MQRCRTTFLSHTSNCKLALLVGEGVGGFLVELLRANPKLKIVCIEKSQNMIQQARQRLERERLGKATVSFMPMDALD